jgi:hypothetical protein
MASPATSPLQTIHDRPFAYLTTFVIALLAGYITYYRHIHPLRRYPGPFIASFSNAWKLWTVTTDRCVEP